MAPPGSNPDSELAREEQRLAELRAQLEAQQARVQALRDRAHQDADEVAAPAASAPGTNAEKIRLFRSLFRGREDVFARRWENPKTGKAGYAPACANEWVPSVCIKRSDMGLAGRRGTCSECTAQAYVPLTDDEIAAHLRGQQVLGVYPLLADETCWFLATDFDDDGWTGDVAAFRETCGSFGVPVAVERSRSGNGAHAWVFFSAPVAAVVARRLGCFLLTETMSRRHQLTMASYDRLFPNQDTMPKGGFGNLIALPLQKAARDIGNSTFVDGDLVPFADQWAFLAGMARMRPGEVTALAESAMRSGRVLGVRHALTGDDESAPWEMPPSGRPPRSPITETLPAVAHAVIAQRLYLEKAGLPSPLLSRIKRIAAFQNPEFYKKQGLRLSTALTPRIISCAEERAEYLVLPRGCADEVATELAEVGVALRLDDRREAGAPFEARFDGVLTEAQSQAARSMLEHDSGILVAPPGSGKTVIGASLIASRGRNTLVLVHRKPLMDQWVAQLALFLGLKPREIGRIGGGLRKVTGQIDVAMLQSLVSQGGVADLVAGYGHVVVDECHHVPAVSFERVLGEVRSRYLTGLTATPVRRDGHHPVLEMQMGAVRHTMNGGRRGQAAPLVCRLFVRNTGFRPGPDDATQGIQNLYARLASDTVRNEQIIADVRAALAEGRSPLVLTERRDHLESLSTALRDAARHQVTLYGGMGAKARRQALTGLTGAPANESRLVLATGRYIGEGFDDSRLDTLFLALPVSWKGTLVQYAGRLHRLREGKTEVRIHDYVDRDVGMLRRMFERRLKGYRAMGYGEVGSFLFK